MKKSRQTLTFYVVIRLLVVAVLVRQIFLQNWHGVFMCVLTLVLFLIPSVIEKRFKVELPNTLQIIILLFIFSAEILGELHNFYGLFPYWDTMLHTINGFLAAAIGFSMIDILNQDDRFHFKMSPLFVALVAFCFSMTIGVLWEFFEFGADQLLNKDMQKDRIIQKIASVKLNPKGENVPVVLDQIQQTDIYYQAGGELKKEIIKGGYLDLGIIDTMKDLIVNCIGAAFFSLFGMLYIKNRDKYRFAERFIPVRKTK